METQEQQMNADESLRVIQSMIASTREGMGENGFIFLFWGWLVFAAAMAQFVLVKMQSDLNSLPWLLMPVGGIVTFIYFRRERKHETVRTYLDEFLGYLWMAFGISLFIVLFFMNAFGQDHVLPLVLVLYGIGTFVSGGALRFKPLIIGGIVCWVMSAAAFMVSVEMQLLMLAAGVIAGYVVPGHLLSAQFKRTKAAA